MNEKVELLSPAGSFESLRAAIDAGADAVYFGVTQLNMRAASVNNFTITDLAEIGKICKKAGVRSYLTINTVLYDHDLKLSKLIIDAVKANGIDAIIVSDMAAVMYARQNDVEVHLSTQMSISNVESIKFYSSVADRIVLARELNLQMVKKICQEIKEQSILGPKRKELVEIEVFIHGAMCVAVSGRCGMSLYTDNSSANRGACKQNCRRAYKVIDDNGNELIVDNNYIMSPEDLCTIGLTDQIINSGVKVLKIEGRGRSPEYVNTVTKCYREAIDAVYDGSFSKEKIHEWMKKLETVYNRGLGTGFYLGKQMEEWSGVYGSKASEEKAYVGDVSHYFPKTQIAQIEVLAETVKSGDEIFIIGPTTGVLRENVESFFANDKPATSSEKNDQVTLKVSKRVRKGDKVYLIKQVENRSGQ